MIIPVVYEQAWKVQEGGCVEFMNGECDDCGLCEISIPDEIRELLEY